MLMFLTYIALLACPNTAVVPLLTIVSSIAPGTSFFKDTRGPAVVVAPQVAIAVGVWGLHIPSLASKAILGMAYYSTVGRAISNCTVNMFDATF